MKLKKIVSLALAGVLAVSMLAGCKNDGSSSSSSSEVVTTPTTGVAAALNDARDTTTKDIVRLTYTESSDLAAILKDAAEDKYGDNVSYIESNAGYTGAKVIPSNEPVYKAIADKLTGTVTPDGMSGLASFTQKGTNKCLLVYTVGGDNSMATVGDYIATKSTSYKLNDLTGAFKLTNGSLKATYSADVAAVKVVSPDDATKTMWVVAVVFTQTIA